MCKYNHRDTTQMDKVNNLLKSPLMANMILSKCCICENDRIQ